MRRLTLDEKHRHHIIPKHMGGLDVVENIEVITVYEHRVKHLILFYRFGKKEDLCAYYMLGGDIEKFRSYFGHLGGKAIQKKRKEIGLSSYGLLPGSERQKAISRMGGLIQGPINAQTGHMSAIQKLSDCSEAGKMGAEVCRKLNKNSFFNEETHKNSARKGGQVQGKKNAESGHLKEITKLSKKNKGMIWINDGVSNKMIKKDEIIPNGFMKGMKNGKTKTI